jgi:hypothetical protein
MTYLMGKAEPITVKSFLVDKFIDRNLCAVATDEGIHFDLPLKTWDRDNVNLQPEVDDFFNRNRQ